MHVDMHVGHELIVLTMGLAQEELEFLAFVVVVETYSVGCRETDLEKKIVATVGGPMVLNWVWPARLEC